MCRARPSVQRERLEIRQVATRRDRNRFVEFPWTIYAHDPQWVPPLLVEVKEFLDRKRHPFYLHGDAATFLALQDDKPLGRILVSDDPNYNKTYDTNLGCFGMFESVDDPMVAGALLNAAAGWLRARGRDAIQGPIDYSMNYPCGLLIEGFDTPPRIMMNHNPPYYAALLEAWGLAKSKDLFGWWFTGQGAQGMLARWDRLVRWRAKRGGVTVRSFRHDELQTEFRRCHEVYNASYRDNWGFVRLTDAEFDHLARHVARITDPRQALVAEVDGKMVGFSIAVPDINEAIRPLDGRLTTFGLPVGLFRMMYRLRRVKTVRVMVLVLLEGYRRLGISELMILQTLQTCTKVLGYTDAELGWTLEDNFLINRTVETIGAKHYKTYRIYQKSL